jgi:hypothetical protein
MAYVQNNQNLDEDNQKKEAQNNPISVGGSQEATNTAQGATAGNPNQGKPQGAPTGPNAAKPVGSMTPGQQQAGASGRFQNLNKFIKANQPGQFGQQFQQKVGQVAQQGQQAIGQAKQQFQSEAGKAGEQLAQTNQAVQNAQGTLVNTSADDTAFNQAAEQLGQGLGAAYQGPNTLSNEDALRFQAQQAADVARAAGSTGGRGALLQKFFAKPTYSAGQNRLDTMLLGSQQGALRNVRQQGRQVSSQLEQAKQDAMAQAEGLSQQAKTIQDRAKELGAQATGNIEGTLKTDAEKYIEESLKMYDPSFQAANLGAGSLAGLTLGDAEKQALAEKGYLGVQGASLSADQLREMQAKQDYSSLLGKTSAGSQAQAARFNKLQQMLGGKVVQGGDLLNKGTVDFAGDQLAQLEGQLEGQGMQGALDLVQKEQDQRAESKFNDALIREADRRYDYQTAKQKADFLKEMKIPAFDPKYKTPENPLGAVPEQVIRQKFAEETAKKYRNRKDSKEYFRDEWNSAQQDAASYYDRNSQSGKSVYEDRLKQSKRDALNRILGIK